MPARRLLLLATLAATGWGGTAATTAAPALASPTAGPPAVVAMGDSYISGEAGRWEGNSSSPAPGHDGSDRAPGGDTSSVYVGGSDDGQDTCHRSDVSELAGAQVGAGVERVNISCSGAVTSDLLTSAEGGTIDHTEPPQGDQLAQVAADHQVKAIVVSVGGNDFGFADIVTACLTAYTTAGTPCQQTQEPGLLAARAGVAAKVAGVADSIRGVMSRAGYAQGSYRLIFQSYPVVIATGADNRTLEQPGLVGAAGPRMTQGCPTYTSDADWFSAVAAPTIGAAVRDAAAARGAEYLELLPAFLGHEICSKESQAVTATQPPSATTSEWGRALSVGFIAQGSVQEVVHPNAFGQRALSTCLSGVLAATPGRFTCTGRAGIAPSALALRQDEAFAVAVPAGTTPSTTPSPPLTTTSSSTTPPGTPTTTTAAPGTAPCLDPAPTSRFSARASRVRASRVLTLRGTAIDVGCRAGLARVSVSVARASGNGCRYLQANGSFARAVTSCKRTRYVTAKGTSRWSLRVGRLPAGRYKVWVRAVDRGGNVERKRFPRNGLKLRSA